MDKRTDIFGIPLVFAGQFWGKGSVRAEMAKAKENLIAHGKDSKKYSECEAYCQLLESYAEQGFKMLKGKKIDQARQLCSRGEELYEELKILFMSGKFEVDESDFEQMFMRVANAGSPTKDLRTELTERFPE